MTGETRKPLHKSAIPLPILVLLVVAFLLLITVAVASTLGVLSTRQFNQDVVHDQTVRELARNVLTDVLEVQSGERGYMITGKPQELGAYDSALARLSNDVNRLQAEAGPDQGQLRRIATLKIDVDAKAAEFKRVVAFVAANRGAEATARMREEEGHDQIRRIRDLINEIDGVEAKRLVKRSAQAERSEQSSFVISVVSVGLVAGAGAASIILLLVLISSLRASRSEIDEVNQGLERTVQDRTRDLVRANKDIRTARDRAETLLREVNHRIGNSLQLASSFIAMQARAVKGDSAKAALRGTQSRLEAVAHIHRSLYTSDDVSTVDLHEYLAGLVEALQGSLAPYPGGPRLSFRAEPLRAPTDRAVSLGVILAELVTNAVKYAYPPDCGGEIRVRLLAPGDRRGVLIVEDDGQGMGEGPAKGTGLGKRIIEAMAANLSARMEYDDKNPGVRARLAFQL
ncbi:MAG TPA: CHASE3 domain-containing protein [Caulobacteraceae bacterium]|jgi:two-component sensor histidine kinase|nr:CHASE3 domain-containing protein [Caulobacteraceae bacterium]